MKVVSEPQLNFQLQRLPTPIGTMLLVTDEEGRLRAADWSDFEERMLRLLQLHYGRDGFRLAQGGEQSSALCSMGLYFDGDRRAIDDVRVKTGGTIFQRKVWSALREIPVGSTTTYGLLAVTVGHPKAIRAVGAANGANPVGIVVPCHRVIGADASLTGYGGGLQRKRWLLEHEGTLPRVRSNSGPGESRADYTAPPATRPDSSRTARSSR
jgi:methylated-DNA-[protein]-cysteine S-methyltransferase